jgi:hypothetical protein
MPIQVPCNIWQALLTLFAWAWRIPVALLVVFTCGSLAFLGFMLVLRLTTWAYQTLLANPW